jgi:hypothetical protein
MSKARAFVASGVLLAIATATSAGAQSAQPDRSWMFNPNSVQQQTITPQSSAKPKAVQAPTAKRTDRKTVQPAAQPKREAPRIAPPTAAARPAPEIAPPTIGRIPFETGTIGLTTNKNYYNSTFSDGRVVPGFENVQTKSPAYFGLSLSVPTDKTSIPLPPLFTRPD